MQPTKSLAERGKEALKKWREENPDHKPVYKNPLEKLQENPKSLRLAINAKCWDCSNFQREQIANCHLTKCGLWHVRPYQKKGEEKDEVDAENS